MTIMPKISITWIRSGIGHARTQRKTIESLGLRRLHQTVVHEDTPSIRGMVMKVQHLVTLSEDSTKTKKRK